MASSVNISSSEYDGINAQTYGAVEIYTTNGNPGVTAIVTCEDAAASGNETDWSNSGSGDWFDAGNWTNSVPGSATLVTNIENGGNATINGAAADAGLDFDLCSGTADLQTGGTLTAGDILIGGSGTLLLSGSDGFTGQIVLDGGTVHSDISGTLSNQFELAESTTSTVSVASGETLTLTGDFLSPGADANFVFGSASDTGTVVFSPSSIPVPGDAAPAGDLEVAGGTLKAGNDALGSLYTASITVDAGATLNFNDQEPTSGNIIIDLHGAGNIVTGSSETTLLTLGAADFSGSISGAGKLNIEQVCFDSSSFCTTGLAELSGTSTYTGTTTITDGTLLIDTGGAITGTSNVNIYTDGQLTVDGSYTGGDIAINSGGAMTINGSVTAGVTVGSGGTLGVESGGTLDATDGLIVDGTANIEGSVTSENEGIEVYSGGDLTVDGATNTQGFEVRGSGIATINGSSTSSSGVIIADHASKLIVSPGGTLDAPPGILISGTLQADGTITSTAGLSVYTGGSVTGTGTIASTQVTSGGTIAPGDSGIGTLNVNGDLSIAEGGIYDAQISSGNADKIAVAGSADIAGTFDLELVSAPSIGTQYTILTATDGITGTFAAFDPTPLGEFRPSLIYGTNDVMLEFELATLSPDLPDSATANETAVAGGIDGAIDPGTPLPDAFQALAGLSSSDLATAATQLSGEMAADLPQIGETAVDPFLDVLVDQSDNRGQDLNGMDRFRRRHDAISTWASGYGEHSSVTGDASGAGSHSLSGSTIGGAAGIDARIVRGFIAGAAFGYGHSTFSLNDELGSGSSNDLQFGIHALADLGRHAYLSGGGVYALQDIVTHRAITLPAAGTLDAKFTAHDIAGRVEAGYRLPVSRSSGLTPFVAGQWTSFDAPRYSETGSSDYALTYDAMSATNSRVELGAAFDDDARITYNTSLYVDARAAYAHAFQSNQDAHAAFAALPGSDFVVQGAAPGDNLALLSFDAELKGRNGFSLGVEGDGSLSQNAQSYFATADLSYTW